MPMQIVTKSSEVRLMETLNAIGEPAGWLALHFRLSDLLQQYQSEYQIKIAVNLAHDLLKEYDGGIFLLGDNSLVVLCYGLEKTVRNKLIFQLRYLYMDDPLAYTEEGDENTEFCATYELARDWRPFMDLCSRRMAMSVRRAPEREAMRLAEAKPEKKNSNLSASVLANIERDLDRADLQKAIRRQPVCAVLPDMKIRRVFDELYIHIAHLRQMLKLEVDFLSDRWLFKYLTRILDQHMIDLIRANPGPYLNSPISLNFNVETLLSSWFAEFDAIIRPEMKVSIVLEVPVVDVFADMRAFNLARREVQKLGYRVCLDGVTSESLSQIDREKLGLDLVKVQWDADVAHDLDMARNKALASAVQATGSNRIILCRCDDDQAIEFGQAMGIPLYQGRHLDNLLNPSDKQQN